jgi:hypothetical protein
MSAHELIAAVERSPYQEYMRGVATMQQYHRIVARLTPLAGTMVLRMGTLGVECYAYDREIAKVMD